MHQRTPIALLQLNFNLLNGAVPSELGQLTALETLKLHGNDLTGAMPDPVCLLTDGINEGVLEPITVDCNEVSCAAALCCTCFR